jgi:uncharacterized membrane protein YfcA
VGEIVATSIANQTLERVFAAMLVVVAVQLAWRTLQTDAGEDAQAEASS